MMEKLFRALNFTPTLLQSFVNNLSPTAQNWADPFGGLIALGNQMVMVAMTALQASPASRRPPPARPQPPCSMRSR